MSNREQYIEWLRHSVESKTPEEFMKQLIGREADHFNTIERSAGVTALKITAGAVIAGLAIGNGLFEIALWFIG